MELVLSAEELREKYRLKGNPRRGLIAATWGFFVGFTAVTLMGAAGPKFKVAMDLSASMLGILVAAPQLSGSLLRIPFGAWVDKVGGKKPLLVLLITAITGLCGLAAILFVSWPNPGIGMYPFILLFVVLSGAGVATFSVGIPQTSYWFPQKRQGVALGAYAGLGNTAPGWFVMIIPFALIVVGLPGAYAVWLAFVAAGTAIYAAIAHDAYYFQLSRSELSERERIRVAKQLGQELIPSGRLTEALKISAKLPRNWGLVVLYFVSFGGFLALSTWFPSYWVLFRGLDLTTSAVFTAIGFTLLASFIRVYGGHLSDRFGGENIALLSFLIVLIGAVMLMVSGGLLADAVGEVTIAAGMGIANAAVFKMVTKYVPEAVGGASGWVGGLGAFGGFVVPPILGYFVDFFGNAGYSLGFITYVILAVLALLVTIALRTHPPSIRQGV
jgi:NNP family nitrate/nitrite transporter-like MFS transporter